MIFHKMETEKNELVARPELPSPRINTLLQVNVAKFPRIMDAKTGTILYTSSTEATKQKSLSFDGIQGSRDVISAEVVDSRDSDSLEDTASAYSLDELGYIECSGRATNLIFFPFLFFKNH